MCALCETFCVLSKAGAQGRAKQAWHVHSELQHAPIVPIGWFAVEVQAVCGRRALDVARDDAGGMEGCVLAAACQSYRLDKFAAQLSIYAYAGVHPGHEARCSLPSLSS